MVSYCDLFQLSGFTYNLSRNIKLKEINSPASAGNRLREGRPGLAPASWPTAAVPCGRAGGPAPRVCRPVSWAHAGQQAALPCRWEWILELPSPRELRGPAGLSRLSRRLSPVPPPPLLPRPEQLSWALASTPAQPAFVTGTLV